MERDPKTGRFLPGHKISVGYKGSRNPKWGNKNAMKHGFYGGTTLAKVHDDGNLYIYQTGKAPIVIRPEGFIQESKYRVRIRDDVAEILEKNGIIFDNE